MRKRQQGFTLIELMIVVAIIGILAAIAVPAYQDYTIRSRVSEGASLAGAAKTAVDVRYSETGDLTTISGNHTSLGLTAAGSYMAKYVTSVNVLANGIIEVTLSANNDLGVAASDTYQYSPIAQGGNLEWTINSAGPQAIDMKYLPRR
ncbi:MAG: pilin [Acidiferrobacterales bacterium]